MLDTVQEYHDVSVETDIVYTSWICPFPVEELARKKLIFKSCVES